MARKGSYIPTRDADFDGWFENLVNYVGKKTGSEAPEWTFIPPDAVSRLSSAYDVWHEAYQKTIGAHSKVETEAKTTPARRGRRLSAPLSSNTLCFPAIQSITRQARLPRQKG